MHRQGPQSFPPTYRPLSEHRERERLQRAKRLRAGLFSIGAIALVTFSMVVNPPVGRTHAFTAASDYRPERESGCTNSGEGCHGEETSYKDFNDYHPNASCTTCHEYQGIGCIPCHSPDGHECQSCHDGTMEKAGDRVRLQDPWPRGHYRETTHTATGTDMHAVVRSAADGKAGARCRACHSRDLAAAHTDVPIAKGSPYGATIGCGECHNDTRSNGLARVKDGWKDRTCESCHREGASTPMHASDIAPVARPAQRGPGCDRTGEGCHAVRDLHGLHPDLPKDCSGAAAPGEPTCHDLSIESHLPTATACGAGAGDACHVALENDELSHAHDAEVHSPGLKAALDRSEFGIACVECHLMADDGVSLLAEHARPTSERPKGGPCRGCHNHPASRLAIENDWPERDGPGACGACHGRAGLDRAHSVDLRAAHRAEQSTGCADSGPGCHPTDDLSSPMRAGADGLHVSCLRCHQAEPVGANRGYDPSAKSCGAGRACHNEPGLYRPNRPVHSADGGPVDGNDPLHTASRAQRDALLIDAASGRMPTCGACHSMQLAAEHARPTASLANGDGTICARCHNHSADTAAVVKDSWPSRGTEWACDACHGAAGYHTGISAAHNGVTLDATGTPVVGACGGTGCHATVDLRVLHAETGCLTAGCHRPLGAIVGSARPTCGGPAKARSCHAGIHEGVDGYDDLHTAGDAQRDATFEDAASGRALTCVQCHTVLITAEHERSNSSLALGEGTVCLRCHTADLTTRAVVRRDWPERDTDSACRACHAVGSSREAHTRIDDVHFAVEHSEDGSATPGACATQGCHPTTDVRALHREAGCTIRRCHTATGDIRGANLMRCGGADSDTTCHRSFSEANHRQSHAADLTGTVEETGMPAPVTYRPGENIGCFGCHARDLAAEHSRALISGSMEGGGSSPCRVCHFNPLDPGSGAYSAAEAVRSAIERSDRRCVACHRSGSSEDTTESVASPHRSFSTSSPLEPGTVWSDPSEEWRTALEAPTGGGHNVLPADVVGAARDKAFPLTEFDVDGLLRPWPLPRNTGATAWLRTEPLTPVHPHEGPSDPLLFPSATTTEGIQAAMVTCEDCHEMEEPAGPQGAAVRIAIDPDYAQTEWSDPTPGTFQFDPYNVDVRNGDNPPGYKPVICVKCHLVYARAREGTTAVYVGGTSYHNTHASRHEEVCIDCHLRIPHAWRRPRLLVRTIGAPGEPADTFPYVRKEHTGLVGIRLTVTPLANPVARDTCATGGCYSGYYERQGQLRSETATNHPLPERDLPPDERFWP